MSTHDKPTTPVLAFDLLTGDEVELLAGICDALVRKERPVALGHTREVRVALKLQAHRRKEPGA